MSIITHITVIVGYFLFASSSYIFNRASFVVNDSHWFSGQWSHLNGTNDVAVEICTESTNAMNLITQKKRKTTMANSCTLNDNN